MFLNRSRMVSSPQAGQEKINETLWFFSNPRFGFPLWQRVQLASSGEASGDAHRWILVRQLNLQHPEGREPSRLRTKTQRD